MENRSGGTGKEKKGKGEDVKDYRGVTLIPTLYELYKTIV